MENMITVATYNNKAFARCVKKINTALQNVSKNAWRIAEQYAKIKNDELWVDDFENETSLCEHLGISRPQFSKMTRSVELIDSAVIAIEKETGVYGKDKDDEHYKRVIENNPAYIVLKSMSVGQVSELLPLGDNVVNVIGESIDCNIDLSTMTCKDLREYVHEELVALKRIEDECNEDVDTEEEDVDMEEDGIEEDINDTSDGESSADYVARFEHWIEVMINFSGMDKGKILSWLSVCPLTIEGIDQFVSDYVK